MSQLQLESVPVDERTLDDVARTVLEAIDKRGSVSVVQAGRIVYRFRGYECLLSVPTAWLVSAGRPVLERLARVGLVHRRGGRLHGVGADRAIEENTRHWFGDELTDELKAFAERNGVDAADLTAELAQPSLLETAA
jgi:ribosomal protein S18 acetylase RimI-like enzyme